MRLPPSCWYYSVFTKSMKKDDRVAVSLPVIFGGVYCMKKERPGVDMVNIPHRPFLKAN